jgi:hypothetical protein
MKVLLSVSLDDHCDFGADYALVDLTPECVQRVLTRRDLLRAATTHDADLAEITFWSFDAQRLTAREAEVPEGISFYDWIDEHLSTEQQKTLSGGDPVQVSDDFAVPSYFLQAVECAQMVVVHDEIHFTSYPRHIDFEQSTSGIPFEVIERSV